MKSREISRWQRALLFSSKESLRAIATMFLATLLMAGGLGDWLRIGLGEALQKRAFSFEPEDNAGMMVLARLKKLSTEKLLNNESIRELGTVSLSQQQAVEANQIIATAKLEEAKESRKKEFDDKVLVFENHEMKFEYRSFGDSPTDGRSLYISMHGGGGAPKQVNDGQWKNQIRLYEPSEGLYVAPRAPTDTWNLWHQAHIDPLFIRLIEDFVLFENVNPDRVYLMGYSAGGDGVYQLAPRMADHFAAASMMAGHPNETEPWGLRNLPFALFMGGRDAAYQRNQIAEQWEKRLGELKMNDPEGYPHLVKIYPDKGHWMDRLDAEGVPWMAQFKRQRWPKKIVWKQDDVTHQFFYWLEVSADRARGGAKLTAEVVGQEIRLDGSDIDAVTLRLNDELVDLDQPIKVVWNNEICFEGKLNRNLTSIFDAYQNELLPVSVGYANLEVVKKSRTARDEEDLKYWLKNILVEHQFSPQEAAEILGLSPEEVQKTAERFELNKLAEERELSSLKMLPYPGGRHPRIGFLDGAIDPQRETKISVFAPWDKSSYVVLDVPEAIWSNLGLTYLAHTHVDTIWTKQGMRLAPLEWNRSDPNRLQISRTLPNGIRFEVVAQAAADHIDLEMTLFNGTTQTLSDLRVQMCAMLKGMSGFEMQTNDNKIFQPPFAVCHDASKQRWLIWGWQPIQRSWGNAPCPCLHADPQFPDCPPGETRRIKGWWSFYQGTDVDAELKRIAADWKIN